MTLPVKIQREEKELLIKDFLDSGSQRTFCMQNVADEMNANGLEQTISTSTLLLGPQQTSLDTEVITLSVIGADEDCSVSLKEVVVVDAFPCTRSSFS